MSRIEKGGPRFRPGAPGLLGAPRRLQANPIRPGQPSSSAASTPSASIAPPPAASDQDEESGRSATPLPPMRPPSIGPSRPPSTTKSFAIKPKKAPRPISIGAGMGDGEGGASGPSLLPPPASLSRPTRPITPAPESLRSASVTPAPPSRRSATPSSRLSASPAPDRRRSDSTASATGPADVAAALERRRRDSTASAAGPSGAAMSPPRLGSEAPVVGASKRSAPSDMGPPVLATKRQKAAPVTPSEPSNPSAGQETDATTVAAAAARAPAASTEAAPVTAPATASEPSNSTETAAPTEEAAPSTRRKPRATAAEKRKQAEGGQNAEAGPSRPARRAKAAAAIAAPTAGTEGYDEDEAQRRAASSDDDSADSDEYTPRRKKSLAARRRPSSASKGKKKAAPQTNGHGDDSDSDSTSATESDEDDSDDGVTGDETEGDASSAAGSRNEKGKGKATQKRKQPRLPSSAPRRPLSSYFLFSSQKRSELQADHPELSFREVAARTGEAWRALSEEDRGVYEAAAKEKRDEWKVALEIWKAQHPNWEAEAAAEAAAPKKRKGKAAKPKGRVYREGEPRRPLSAYMLFCARRREEMTAAHAEALEQGKEPPATDPKAFMHEAGNAWKALGEEAKAPFVAEAKKLRDEYNVAIDAWEAEHPSAFEDSDAEDDGASTDASTKSGGKKRRRRGSQASARRRRKRRRARASGIGRKRTKQVSDDEAEYLAQVAEDGEELRNKKLNARTVSMADLSVPELAVGRAGPRTFQLRRVYRELQDKRRAELKQMKIESEAAALHPGRAANSGTAAASSSQAGASNVANSSASTSAPASQPSASQRRAPAVQDDDEEEIVGEVEGYDDAGPSRRGASRRDEEEEEEPEEEHSADEERGRGSDDDDAESVGGASAASTHMSFKENRFAVRVRQVNGQIVIDESSLHANLGEGVEEEGHEFVEENDREKFITSATRGKRKGAERWDAEETDKFLKAVSMWGTDFEMIARLFPRRNRKQIKAKWRAEERSNSDRLHAAFSKPQKVDLEEYSAITGVDFSGPPPVIQAKKPPLADDEDEEGGPGSLFDAKRESMEHGAGVRKTSQTPQPNGGARPSGTSRNERGATASSRAGSASAASASGVEDLDAEQDGHAAPLSIDEVIARNQAAFRKSQQQAASGGGGGGGQGQGRKRSNSASSRGKGQKGSSSNASRSGGRNAQQQQRRREEDDVEIVGDA